MRQDAFTLTRFVTLNQYKRSSLRWNSNNAADNQVTRECMNISGVPGVPAIVRSQFDKGNKNSVFMIVGQVRPQDFQQVNNCLIVFFRPTPSSAEPQIIPFQLRTNIGYLY